jgi:hypothetical protein
MRLALATFMIVGTLLSPWAVAQDPRDTQPVPGHQVLADRPDIAAAIYAAAAEMRGTDNTVPEITITPDARRALRTDGFDYAGFGPPRFTLMRFAENESNPAQTDIGVVMVFSDAILRRFSMSVLLTCSWNEAGDHITVHDATVERVTPAPPQTMLVIVPAERVPADLLTSHSHAQLLPWLLENRATDEELASGAADECYLFAFNYDRFNPGASLELLVDRQPGGITGQAGNGQDIDYGGWHVAVMNGTFDWGTDETFYIKMIHTPASDPNVRGVLGILSSDLEEVDHRGRPVGDGPLSGLSDRVMLILAGVLGAVGLLVVFLGYRLGRVFLGLVGLLVGGVAASVMIELIQLGPIYFWAVLVGLPIVGAALFGMARWLGWLLTGAAVGGAIAILFHVPLALTSVWLWVALGIGALVALVLHRFAIILVSAYLGTTMVALAAGQYLGMVDLRAWRVDRLYGSFVAEPIALAACFKAMGVSMWMLVVLSAVLFVMGVLVQLATTRRKAQPAAAAPQELLPRREAATIPARTPSPTDEPAEDDGDADDDDSE